MTQKCLNTLILLFILYVKLHFLHSCVNRLFVHILNNNNNLWITPSISLYFFDFQTQDTCLTVLKIIHFILVSHRKIVLLFDCFYDFTMIKGMKIRSSLNILRKTCKFVCNVRIIWELQEIYIVFYF